MTTSEELGFTKSHYRRLRKPRIRQVPRRQVHDYADCTKYPFRVDGIGKCETPSTTTTIDMYPYTTRKCQVPLMSARPASRTPNDRCLMDHVQLPSPRRRWSHQVPLRTNVNDYRRKNGTGKSEDPKYHATDDMNIYENSCNDKHVPLPSPRSREPLPSTLEHARTTTSTTVVARTPTSLYEREPSPLHAPKV